jgi:hypothetical protein
LEGQSAFLLGTNGEDFVLARDETVFRVEAGLGAASLRRETRRPVSRRQSSSGVKGSSISG